MRLIPQQDKLDCGVACVAMLLDCSYEKAVSYFDLDFSCQVMEFDVFISAVEEYGKNVNINFDPKLRSRIIVPFLNYENQKHAVCWDGEKFMILPIRRSIQQYSF